MSNDQFTEAAARAAADRHHSAINLNDIDAYLETVHYPFTYQNYTGLSMTVRAPEEYRLNFKMPWEIIRTTEPHWIRTDLIELHEIAKSNSSAVFKYVGERINSDGHAALRFQAIWISVFKSGSWRIQFRHNLGALT